MSIAGILLAAGAGTRFGGGKLLAEIRPGVAMCVAALDNLRASVDEVLAVVREGDDAVAQMLQKRLRPPEGVAPYAVAHGRVQLCANAHEGMGASLSCGVRATPEARGWIIALGDMPLIKPETIRALAAALCAGSLIVAPSYRGERGHPVGFAAALREELIACSGDAGARAVVQAHRSALRLIEVDDSGVIADFDTREQLARFATPRSP